VIGNLTCMGKARKPRFEIDRDLVEAIERNMTQEQREERGMIVRLINTALRRQLEIEGIIQPLLKPINNQNAQDL
jgi:hypothetical protein